MYQHHFPSLSIRTLNSAETKDTIQTWWNQVRAFARSIPTYQKYMDLVWTSHSLSPSRGFRPVNNADGSLAASPETQSTQVEALIDLICSYAPELDVSHIRSEADSLAWIYNYIREHYGCKRTGRQMMSKYSTLKRRDGERLNAYWNRWQGFWADNRIRKDDSIKIEDGNKLITPTKDEIGERYRLSSDIVACLHMAHPDLPSEVEKLLSGKLENQDVASLQKEIFVKANIALEQLERQRPAVRQASFNHRRPQRPAASRRPASTPGKSSKLPARKPSKPEHFCSSCVRNKSDQASTHFIKDCPFLSESDRTYLLKLYDKALQHRSLSVEDWDGDMSQKFVDLVEDYYGLSANISQLSLTPDDLVNDTGGPSSEVLDDLANFDINASVVLFHTGDFDSVTLRRINIGPSPSFSADIKCHSGKSIVNQLCIVDSGCTGECIISKDFADRISAVIQPTSVRSAKLADKQTSLPIIGITRLDGDFKGNKFTLNALVSKEGDPVLLGIPGAEKLALVINTGTKELTFRNGVSISYRAITCEQVSMHKVSVRRLLLQTPRLQTMLPPGEQIQLSVKGNTPNGFYAVQPCPSSRATNQAVDWLKPEVLEVQNNKVVISSSSGRVYAVPGKSFVAEAFPLIDPDSLHPQQAADALLIQQATDVSPVQQATDASPVQQATDASPVQQATDALLAQQATDALFVQQATDALHPADVPPSVQDPDDPTWRDITTDPHNKLSASFRNKFTQTNQNFATVFQSDLPKYNGAFGKVEASITVPHNLPQSARLKDVPWYPRKMLVELQEKFDSLETKGALARPQDIGVNVTAVSPSFLVKKKEPSTGYRLVTAFGNLAQHVRNPPAPIVSTDQVLRKLSSWKYIIKTDISNAYHQIPLSQESLPLAGVSTPFKGLRIYLTAAMGMPGSEVALGELTALLFGPMRQEGVLECLMDDVIIGGNSEEELHQNWVRFLTICKEADIRLGPRKVVISPAETEVLGWTWKQGGILEVNQHASSRLQKCKPPTTAEGLRGWVGAYKFMSTAIRDFAKVLEPLNKAIGDKTRKDPIVWTEDLLKDFKRAQESLRRAEPLTMPRQGEQLYMTTDASQLGLGATLHRAADKAVVKHFSKQLSAHKKNWLPCELEALAVGAGLQFFLPFFRESGCKPIIYTDSSPVAMAYKKMQQGLFSTSPRVSTFLHEVLNQGAEVRFLAGTSNLPADQASRNPTVCNRPRCQVCCWISEKEDQVVRRLTPQQTDDILAGNNPLPFQSRLYWRRRQLEDRDLKIVAHHLKFGSTPPKDRHLVRAKRYLQTQHKLYLSADNVLLAPSVKAFSTTPRFVVPEAALPSIVSIYHQQFGCLPVSPLKDLLRRHFFALNLDAAVTSYVNSCMHCAATRDKQHVQMPMSTTTPPKYIGERFACDVIKREKQKILVLRETVTSYTWTAIIKDEKASTLESGLRSLFAQVRPPNAARPASCRVDNAQTFVSITLKDGLDDIGVKLDLSNPANSDGNPIAEKANRELHHCLVTVQPSGGKLTRQTLANATSLLNSKPRWSTMSAVELWTGRDMVTGHSLVFDQQDIIRQQHARRLKSHPNVKDTPSNIKPGDIVFCNTEGSKLKARDKLIVREDLGGGMFRLDRLHDSTGRVTRAFLPGSQLYKPSDPETAKPPAGSLLPEESPSSPTDIPTPPSSPANTPTQAADILVSPVAHHATTNHPTCDRKPIPVAPGKSSDYSPPLHPIQLLPFFFPHVPEEDDFIPNCGHEPLQPMQEVPSPQPPSADQQESDDDFASAAGSLDPETPPGLDRRDQARVPLRGRAPRPKTPTPPSVKRSRHRSSPPERPRRQVIAPQRLVYDHDGQQHLTREPQVSDAGPSIKEKHSESKKEGWRKIRKSRFQK